MNTNTTTTTTTVTTTSTMDSLIGGYRAHVLGRALPTPVTLSFSLHNREVAVQPDGGLDTVRHLGNILVWAYTLTDVTARWWHTTDDRLHVSIHGRSAGGVRINVFGGCDFAACLGLVDLESGRRDGVSLDELYALVGLLRETQHERGAA